MSRVRVLLSPPLLVLHVLGLLAVGIAGWMGWWQLSAWQDHREDRAAQLADEDPRPLAEVLGPDDPFPGEDVGRPVSVGGVWLPASTVYVADRRRSAEAPDEGFWQVGLLAACPVPADCAADLSTQDAASTGAAVVPVVLGWTPTPEAGAPAPRGAMEVTGWLQPAEQSGRDEDPGDDVVPSLRTADLLQRTDRDLYSGYLILDLPKRARAGLVAVTPDSLPDPPPSTALRNLLYGLEWWVFAGFAAYLWWRWSRDAVAQAGREDRDEPVVSNV